MRCPLVVCFVHLLPLIGVRRGGKRSALLSLSPPRTRFSLGVHGEYLQTILVQPKSVEVTIGGTIIFDCTVFNQHGAVAW